MQRIDQAFKKGKVFIAYLTAGDESIDKTVAAANALIAAGVGLLEIGVPFSDPIADGPVIQAASARALVNGTTLEDVLDCVKKIRATTNIPIILFTYCNPIWHALQQGNFLSQVKQAGADGLLIVDLPPEEAKDYCKQCAKHELSTVFVVTPNTDLERAKLVAKHSQGFLYYACRSGTTGARQGLPEGFAEKIAQFRQATQLPIAVGFGVSEKNVAKEILQYADGFVVGSYFVDALAKGATPKQLTALASEINPL